MSETVTPPWAASVVYRKYEETTDEQARCFKDFIKWFAQLERSVIETGMDAEGFAPSTPALKQFLWMIGINHIIEGCPEVVGEELSEMPPFPSVWPDTHPVDEVRQRLNEFNDLKRLQPDEDNYHILAHDLREQAIQTLNRSQVFATL